METRHYTTALRRAWWIIVVGALVGAVLGWGLSQLVKPAYTATAQVYVSLAQGNSAGELANGANYNQQQMASYAEITTSAVVLDPVISELGLNTSPVKLGSAVSVSIPQGTTILQIAVTDPSAGGAAKIANSIATSVGNAITDVSPKTITGGKNVTIRTIDPATPPPSPSSPKVALNTILGVVAGLLIALGVVLLRARYDNRVRREADLADATDVPVLRSIVAASGPSKTSSLVMVDRPQSPAAESYRQLRADLSFVAVDGSHAVFVVTSALPREGKSTLVCNLALAMAEAGVRALVIDADLRRPAIASYFGLEGAAGLTTVLSGRATFTDLVQTWGDSTLDILTAGVLPPNPSELLSARAMATLVEDVADIYDVVLIDSPPALSIADAAILGRLGDGALVVADAAQVRRPQLQQTIQSLQTAGVPVLGAVLNRVPSDKSSDVYYT